MFPKILSQAAKHSLDQLKTVPLFQTAYLAGGTALALQIGHRYSYDLDFFTSKQFDERILTQQLGELLADFRLDFYYKYPLLFPIHEFYGIQIADVKDIAPMKIAAIAGRTRENQLLAWDYGEGQLYVQSWHIQCG